METKMKNAIPFLDVVFVEYKHINHTEMFLITPEDANFWNWFEVEQEFSGATIAPYEDFSTLFFTYEMTQLSKDYAADVIDAHYGPEDAFLFVEGFDDVDDSDLKGVGLGGNYA
jgi:hypothetical protein